VDLAQEDKAMSVGLGILGLGVQGRRMMSRMPEHGGVRAVAAWDPDPGRLGDPGVPLAGSPEELVAMAGVDCVFIASPPALHMAQSNLAFDAGKAVFCEKPLAVSSEEALETIARIEREGLRAAVNFSLAASAGLEYLLEPLDADALGSPRAVEIEVAFKEWPRPWQSGAGRWLAERREGGFTREVLSHFVFAMQRLLGAAQVVRSRVSYPKGGVGSELALSAELTASGLPVSIEGHVGGDAADFNRFTLVCEHGNVELREWFGKLRKPGSSEFATVSAGGRLGYLRQLDQLVAFVKGEPHLLPDFAEALAVQQTIEAMLEIGSRPSRG
jgi:predicted dehydrogenase